jgi:prepilin signal peptidase PulO-like enzyme (type II secretory pathway)
VVGLGGGDIKLFSALGIHLGVQGIIYNIFMSCFVGAVVGIFLLITKKINADRPFAFGPSIVLVSIIQILYPEFFDLVIKLFIS